VTVLIRLSASNLTVKLAYSFGFDVVKALIC